MAYGSQDYDVQWIWFGDSGLPTDRYITTFAFQGVIGNSAAADGAIIKGMLQDFWEQDYGNAAGNAIGEHLSAELNGFWQMRMYALTDPQPRVPVYTFDRATAYAGMGSTRLPSEVALCASFAGDIVSGDDAGRHRGRVYIGPLASSSNILGTDGRPAASIITALKDSMQNLESDGGGLNPTWCVNSRRDQALYQVTHGFVDNAFDTQRRRGAVPTVRTTWAA